MVFLPVESATIVALVGSQKKVPLRGPLLTFEGLNTFLVLLLDLAGADGRRWWGLGVARALADALADAFIDARMALRACSILARFSSSVSSSVS